MTRARTAFVPPNTARRPFGLPAQTEDEIQIAVFRHLRTRGAKGIVAWHPKNGGAHQSTAAQRQRNAALGVLAGIQDVHVLMDGRLYALELKTDTGTFTKEQSERSWEMERAGAIVGVAYGLESAITWLEDRGILKGKLS